MRIQPTVAILAAAMLLFITPTAIYAAEDIVISAGKKVDMNYKLIVDGEEMENTYGKEPLQYVHGQGEVIPGLEKELEGRKAGDKLNVTIPAADAYGDVDPEAVVEVPKDRLPEGEVRVGSPLTVQTQTGQTLRAVLKEEKSETVLLDFNHPLAGKEITFEVEIVDVA